MRQEVSHPAHGRGMVESAVCISGCRCSRHDTNHIGRTDVNDINIFIMLKFILITKKNLCIISLILFHINGIKAILNINIICKPNKLHF